MGTPPPPPPLQRAFTPPADAEVVRNIEVLAAFVVKDGPQFEQLARAKTAGDPKFGFLLGGSHPPGSEAAKAHDFYEWKKQRLKHRIFSHDGSDDLQIKICKLVYDSSPTEAIMRGLKTGEKQSPRSVDRQHHAAAGPREAGRGQLEKREPMDKAVESEKNKAVESEKNKRKKLDASGHDSVEKVEVQHVEGANIGVEIQQKGTVDVEMGHEGDEDPDKLGKEARGLKLLRTTLADYAKEVLKPTWKEGHLSKDAYKNIVKKVVEKVVSTVQSHQIPKSQENVDQYMEQSGAKITKLVQGYVERLKKN